MVQGFLIQEVTQSILAICKDGDDIEALNSKNMPMQYARQSA